MQPVGHECDMLDEGLNLTLEDFFPCQSFISLLWFQQIMFTPLQSMNQKDTEKFGIHKETGTWNDSSPTKISLHGSVLMKHTEE